jgi:hypothetical protein
MSAYSPPIENVPMFNATNFSVTTVSQLSSAEADKRYLQYPIAQGTETLSDVTVNGFASFNGSASFTTPPSCSSTTFTSTNLITQKGLLPLNNEWTGSNTFNTKLPTSTLVPTATTELTTKQYVDSQLNTASLLTSNNTWSGTNQFTKIPTTTATNTATNTKEFATIAYITSVASNYLKLSDSYQFVTQTAANTAYASKTALQNVIDSYVTTTSLSTTLGNYLTTNAATNTYLTTSNAALNFGPIPKAPKRTTLTVGSGTYNPPIGTLHLHIAMVGGGAYGVTAGNDSTFTGGGLDLKASGGKPVLNTKGGDLNYTGQGTFSGTNYGKGLNGGISGDSLVKVVTENVIGAYSYNVGIGGSYRSNDGLIIVTAHFQ